MFIIMNKIKEKKLIKYMSSQLQNLVLKALQEYTVNQNLVVIIVFSSHLLHCDILTHFHLHRMRQKCKLLVKETGN